MAQHAKNKKIQKESNSSPSAVSGHTLHPKHCHSDNFLNDGAKRKHKKKRILLKVIIGITACLVLAVCVALAIFFATITTGKNAFLEDGDGIDPPKPAITNDEGKTIIRGEEKYILNEDVISLCIMACDRRPDGSTHKVGVTSYQADAIMVLALDSKSGKINVITIPRNSYVEVRRPPQEDGDPTLNIDEYLCVAFAYGKDDAEGCELTTEAVSKMFYDLPIHYYYMLYWEGLGKLADSVDGVELEAIQTLTPFGIEKGKTYNFTSDNAISYVQYRDINQESSMDDRQARQQQFIKAFAHKALEKAKQKPMVLLDIYNTLNEYSLTNLEEPEVLFLVWSIISNGVSDVEFKTITGTWEFDHKFPRLIPDEDQIFQTLLDVYYTKVK